MLKFFGFAAGTNLGVHEKTRFYEKNTVTLVSIPYKKNKVNNRLVVRGEIDVKGIRSTTVPARRLRKPVRYSFV